MDGRWSVERWVRAGTARNTAGAKQVGVGLIVESDAFSPSRLDHNLLAQPTSRTPR